MNGQRISFVFLCCVLYVFQTSIFAKEVSYNGDCPNTIKPLSNFSMSELSGVYTVAAYYSKGSSLFDPDPTCNKIRFDQISDTRTDVQVRYLSPPLPIMINYRLRTSTNNGTFQMRDSIFGTINLGQAYILSNSTYVMMYTCRPVLQGFIKTHARDVLMLSKNETTTWTTEDNDAAKPILQDNGLEFGILKEVEQGSATCNSVWNAIQSS